MRLQEQRFIEREIKVAQKVCVRWKCSYGSMGPYSPFDVYFMRDQDFIGLAEIRTRFDRRIDSFQTILLDMDKWFSLMQCEIVLRKPSFYIIAFTDGIYFLRVGELPVSDFKMSFRGRNDRPQAVNDLSPVIEVPIKHLKYVCDSEEVFSDCLKSKGETA